jgi:hypothetical protein
MEKNDFLKIFYLTDYADQAETIHGKIIVEAIGSLPAWAGDDASGIVAATTFSVYSDSPGDWFNATNQFEKWAWAEAQAIPPQLPRNLHEGEVYLNYNGSAGAYVAVGAEYILAEFTRWAIVDQKQKYNIDSDVPQVWLLSADITYRRVDVFAPATEYLWPDGQRERGVEDFDYFGKASRRIGSIPQGIAQFVSQVNNNWCAIPCWAVGFHQCRNQDGEYPDWTDFGFISIGNIGFVDKFPSLYFGTNAQYNGDISAVFRQEWHDYGNESTYTALIYDDFAWNWRNAGRLSDNSGTSYYPPLMPLIGGWLPRMGGASSEEVEPEEVYGIRVETVDNIEKDGWLSLAGSGCLFNGSPVRLGEA